MTANEHELKEPPTQPARLLIVDGGRGRVSLAGLVATAVAAGTPAQVLPDLSPRKPRIFTLADEDRMQAAEQKRQRKAAKRLKGGAA